MNTNKTNIVLRLFAAMLFLTASPPAFSQEYIREVTEDYLLCDTSIIRAIGNDTVLIYNKRDQSTFMMVHQGIDTISTLYWEDIFVNDFEVINKMVYFCGYKLEGNVKKAIYGNFKLPISSNTDVYYSEWDTCMELKKIDFYVAGDLLLHYEEHIVMTGSTGTRSDVIVDKVVFSTVPPPPFPPPYPPLGCRVYFSNNEYENFDDIAVTDNYIVVSSRSKIEGIPVIDFWQFDRPPSAGMYLFPSMVNHLRVGSPSAETPVFLEHAASDDYAAVYKVSGFSPMAMLLLTAPNTFVNCVEIMGEETINIPMDIKYNKKTDVFDILARSRYRDDSERIYAQMQIYHVTPAVISNTVPYGMGTKYSGFRLLWSIDPTKDSYHFVASGAESQIPRLFKYRHDQWKSCPDRLIYRYETGKLENAFKRDEISDYKVYKLEQKTIETWLHKIPFPLRCGGFYY